MLNGCLVQKSSGVRNSMLRRCLGRASSVLAFTLACNSLMTETCNPNFGFLIKHHTLTLLLRGETRKLKEWIVDCQKKKKQLSRDMVWDEAMKMDPTMFGGRNAEGWTIKMSRWYYKFLQREDLSIKEKESGGRGRPRSKPPSELVSGLPRCV